MSFKVTVNFLIKLYNASAFNPFLRFFSLLKAAACLLSTAALLRSKELFPQRRASFVPQTNCTRKFPRDPAFASSSPAPGTDRTYEELFFILDPASFYILLPPVEWGHSTEFSAAGSRSFFIWCLL